MPLPRPDEQPLPSRRALREAERARAAAPGASSAERVDPAERVGSARPVEPVLTRRALRLREAAASGTPARVPAEDVVRRTPPVVPVPAARVAPPAVVVPPSAAVPSAFAVPPAVAVPPATAASPAAPVTVAPVTVPPVERHVIDLDAGADHDLEGGDDEWLDDVTPRPTPVGAHVDEEPTVVPARARSAGSAWRRVPQMLVVGSLVAATAGYASTSDISATAVSVPQFVREEVAVAAAPATVLADIDTGSALVAGEDGLLRVRGEEEASRAGDRTLLPGCDGVPPEVPQANGRIDESFLCTLWDGKTEIRADAAVSLALLNEEYRAEFGTDICMTDGYRSYAAQAALKARKPGLAARAGTSEHGFGLAVDLCGGVENEGPGYWWLRENGGEYGFENPRWAQRGGSGPFEPWHWEYTAGQW